MDLETKVFLIILVLFLDLLAVILPITAIIIVVILSAKPKWFKEFVDELYIKK